MDDKETSIMVQLTVPILETHRWSNSLKARSCLSFALMPRLPCRNSARCRTNCAWRSSRGTCAPEHACLRAASLPKSWACRARPWCACSITSRQRAIWKPDREPVPSCRWHCLSNPRNTGSPQLRGMPQRLHRSAFRVLASCHAGCQPISARWKTGPSSPTVRRSTGFPLPSGGNAGIR
ncbi:hypothetical protein D9M72_446790 [compost metagenome]